MTGVFYIRALLGDELEISDVELPRQEPGSAVGFRLRCLPGATALHLVVADRQEILLRAEVPATGGETVTLRLELDEDGEIHLSSPGRNALLLPLGPRFEPPPPLRPAPSGALDLALVVDGTSRLFESREIAGPSHLLGHELWKDYAGRLLSLGEALAKHYREDPRLSILGFGDQEPPGAVAADLMPRYQIFPMQSEARALRPLGLKRARRALRSIPATSGGDFVDALADALEASAELRWRPEARKVVVLFGDSPGHSIQFPAPTGGDAGVRERDVDLQAMKLHGLGVEIVTVYLSPAEGLGLRDVEFRAELLSFASEQYTRLASLPEMAFEAATFDPLRAAKVIVEHQGPIARGPAVGELIEVLPQETLAAR